MARHLVLRFEDAATFARAYERDMGAGGAFVPTTDDFELREIVEVELVLSFCGESVALDAEVVHRVDPATAGDVRPGVAVQFLCEAGELRQRLERFVVTAPAGRERAAPAPRAAVEMDPAAFDPSALDLGGAGPGPPGPADPLAGLEDRRRRPREAAHVPVRVEARHVSLEGLTRNLSETGVLISADATELPVGREVRLELTHPETGERLELPGRVARHVDGEGTVAAVAVDFVFEKDPPPAVREFVAHASRAEVQRLQGGITGRVEELGMPDLLQMFANSGRGTLTVQHGSEEAVVAFEGGMLRYARLGALRDRKALVRLLGWEDGAFAFTAAVDALADEDAPQPFQAVLLDALRALDESRRGDRSRPEATCVFRVDRAALARENGLSKTEEAVIDLAAAGFTVRRILDVIPEADAEILEALCDLEERGVLVRTSGE